MWQQRQIRLRPRPRGFHLVTREIVEALPELGELRVGLAHLHLLHTSASLTLNENASPDVRRDFASWFDRAVPEDASYWTHTVEGPDDMPAHVKASLLGSALSLPVRDGRLALGTWQGVYLCEHRDRGGARSLMATLWGEERGAHGGGLEPHSDGQGASFVPDEPFEPGEEVTVRTELSVRGVEGGEYRFTVARPAAGAPEPVVEEPR